MINSIVPQGKVEYATYSLHSKMEKHFWVRVYMILHQQLQAYLRKLHLKAINHIGASKYLWENPENALKMGYHKPEGN
jgi:hypothetical protein